jgi:DNA-binding response OmpR family regulator
MKLLLARLEAVFRRVEPPRKDRGILSAGPINLDRGRHEVKVDNVLVSLTTTEFGMLEALMEAGERVLTREQLINKVLGPNAAVTDRTIDVHIAALRKKIGDASAWIQTIRGVGYTLRSPQASGML